MSTSLHLTAAEFDRMVTCGAFDHLHRKVELIRGELREMNPGGPLYDDLIMFLTGWSARSTSADQISVTAQTGLDLASLHSRPEPDLLWGRAGRYQEKHPSADDVKLAIEVSHSSLNDDLQEKGELYAEAGTQEYWLVDAGGACVHVFRSPQGKAFTDHTIARRGDRISPLAAPEAVLDLDDLIG
ncbi:MAG: Uma2 family endonuclease [Phycisphaera sp. RhM]|nr:Uma2 family endonuclease [Phycisphaera sp. RhM]